MAKDGVEVEIKIPVTKKIFEEIKKNLKRKVKLVGVSRDLDKYFNAPHRNFLEKTPTEEFLRVRIKKDASFFTNNNTSKKNVVASFTYKHGYWNSKGEHTHSDESETRVENFEQLEKILDALSFKKILVIDKIREIYKVRNTFEISLDKVKGLGYFIEIESLKSFGNIDKAMEAIYTFAKNIGLDPTTRDSKGYVTLMLEKSFAES